MLEVRRPGPLASLQDLGRWGRQALGIGTAGAMDLWAARVANAVLDTPEGAPLIELTLGGAELQFGAPGWLALCGAETLATLDGVRVPLCAPVPVAPGGVLRLGVARLGCRSYLAVRGGFDAERVLGSAATDLRGGFGGHCGRALRRGDCIAYGADAPGGGTPPRWFTSLAHPACAPDAPLGLIAGPALEQLAPADRDALFAAAFTVSPDADRMGLRLAESLPSARGLPQQLSSAVSFGTLQLPPDGRAIMLGADRQTTGGYPVAGVVAAVDHWRIAQARPGDRLRFCPLDVAAAQRLWRARERRLERLRVAVRSWWQER